MQIAFFHISTDRHRCGTTAPCTSQAQAKTSVCTAQEDSATSECDATDASQAAAKERARTHGVVLISIAALFGVPRLRGLGSARHNRRLKAELRAVAPPPSTSTQLLFQEEEDDEQEIDSPVRSQTSLIKCKRVSSVMQQRAHYLIVDGHSIIFGWPELRKLHARRSSLAREALIKQLRDYQDWTGVRVVVVFDGKGTKSSATSEPCDVQIFYSRSGQSADAIIERLASKYAKRYQLMVATSDSMEAETVLACGAEWISPEALRGLLSRK